MATEVTKFESQQELRVGVNGPDGANSLLVLTGLAVLEGGATKVKAFRFLLGPAVEHQNFHGAVAMAASPSRNAAAGSEFRIRSVDAEWDDETKQVEVKVEALFSGPDEQWISYQVTMLAELPDA